MIDGGILDEFESMLDAKAGKSKSGTSSTTGTVSRIDNDGSVWVRLAGASTDTPCRSTTVAVKPGDTVDVEVGGGSARVTGNVSTPATDDTTAQIALAKVSTVLKDTEEAKTAAEQAQAVAEATNQHFWHDDSGAHVTEVTRSEWNDETDENYHAGSNVLVNSFGMLLRKALNFLASFAPGSVTFFDGQGNQDSNITASYDKEGAHFYGKDYSGTHKMTGEFTPYYLATGYDTSDMEHFKVGSPVDSDGYIKPHLFFEATGVGLETFSTGYEHVSSITVWANGSEMVEGTDYEVVYGDWGEPTSICFLKSLEAGDTIEIRFRALDVYDTMKFGPNSHASGKLAIALGESTASGWYSKAEGWHGIAEGDGSYAGGGYDYYPAMGVSNPVPGGTAHGMASVARGPWTDARGRSQVVIGESNVIDEKNPVDMSSYRSEYAFIVGNGTWGLEYDEETGKWVDTAFRSNALTLDWDGNLDVSGVLKMSSTSTYDIFASEAITTTQINSLDGFNA